MLNNRKPVEEEPYTVLFFFLCYHWVHEINRIFKWNCSASATPGNKGIYYDYHRGVKRRQLFYLESPQTLSNRYRNQIALYKDKEPSRTGWAKLLCFKMTGCGSRLFSIKTQRQSTRLGDVKNWFRCGKTLKSCKVRGSAVCAGEKNYMLTLSCSAGIQLYNGYIHIYSGTLRRIGFKLEFLLYKTQWTIL